MQYQEKQSKAVLGSTASMRERYSRAPAAAQAFSSHSPQPGSPAPTRPRRSPPPPGPLWAIRILLPTTFNRLLGRPSPARPSRALAAAVERSLSARQPAPLPAGLRPEIPVLYSTALLPWGLTAEIRRKRVTFVHSPKASPGAATSMKKKTLRPERARTGN